MPNTSSSILLTLAMLAACAGSAAAQNALGDGSALDANTGQQGTRNYTRPNFAAEIRFRNAIATGNAPGGLSFRGDLGYRAPGEFSGDLGSDSLFAFRRDSLYSGLAGMGIRGTDALQYQFALTTGSTPPQNLVGNMSLARDNYYNPSQYQSSFTPNASRRINQPNTTLEINPSLQEIDPRGSLLSASSLSTDGGLSGVLRSSSTYTTTSNLQPSLLSVYAQGIENRPIGLISSPLLGVTSTPMAQEEPQNPLVSRPTNANVDPSTNNGLESTKLVTSYDGLVEQMRERVENLRSLNETNPDSSIKKDETNDEWLVRQMQDLREKLYGTKPANENSSEDVKPDAKTDLQPDPDADSTQLNMTPGLLEVDPDDPLNSAIQQKITGEDPEDQSALNALNSVDPTIMTIDPLTLEVLRGSGADRISRFIDPRTADRDVYSEHIEAGQRLLASGQYFDAEERFTHALSIKPGDISAQIGRFHAQIGAGMVLSASVNLQTLFSTYPEVISSRYTGDLLPSDKRMKSLIYRLKERAGLVTPEFTTRTSEGPRVRVAAAILLAYLGYQTEDQAAVKEGLDLVKELGSDADNRFASLVGQIWITDGDLKSGAPATHD